MEEAKRGVDDDVSDVEEDLDKGETSAKAAPIPKWVLGIAGIAIAGVVGFILVSASQAPNASFSGASTVVAAPTSKAAVVATPTAASVYLRPSATSATRSDATAVPTLITPTPEPMLSIGYVKRITYPNLMYSSTAVWEESVGYDDLESEAAMRNGQIAYVDRGTSVRVAGYAGDASNGYLVDVMSGPHKGHRFYVPFFLD